MSTIKQALQRIASEVPETRPIIVALLRRHATCECGEERLAGELDEMFAGRGFDVNDGCVSDGCGKNKGEYGKNLTDPGKWQPVNRGKGKCYYETGDVKDRCYTTTNGGPNGKKPDTGSASNRQEYNKKYIKQRWDKDVKQASERLAELRAMRQAKVLSKLDSMGKLNEMRKEHGGSTKAYYAEAIKLVKGGVIAPSAVVGGGYKPGRAKGVAIKWLEDQMAKAKTASRASKSLDALFAHQKKHGLGTKAYFAAVLKDVKAGVIHPTEIIGGGDKADKAEAIRELEKDLRQAKK